MTGETDEDRLAGLFRAAASETDAPPPRFDHGDVIATSRRITAGRRSAVIGGAVALLVLAGVGTVVALPRGQTAAVTAAAPAAPAQRNAAAAPGGPEAAVGGGGPGGMGPGGMGPGGMGPGGAGAGGAGPGGAGPGGGGTGPGGQAPGPAGIPGHPLGPGDTACADRQDPALRALVVQVLPEAADARAAATTDICLPGGQRYVSLELGGGVLTVGYLPPGTAASLAEGASSAPTASGGTVIVTPPPGYRARAPALLAYLAPRL